MSKCHEFSGTGIVIALPALIRSELSEKLSF